MRTTVDALLFDFDYTLADASPGILQCMHHALESLGHEPPDDETIRRQIGLPLWGTLERLYGREAAHRDDDFVRIFVARADEIMADNTRMLDGVPDVLDRLRDTGLKMGVVSTKYRYRIEEILARDGLREHFDCIVGGEDVEKHKPHPEPLHCAIEALRVETSRALYLGDSVVDAEAAARAGLRFVAVLSGVTESAAFDGHPSAGVLPSVCALPGLLGMER